MDDRAYVPEPYLEMEHRKIWYRFAFIPYGLTCKVHDFMGPWPKYIKKRNCYMIISLYIMGMNHWFH